MNSSAPNSSRWASRALGLCLNLTARGAFAQLTADGLTAREVAKKGLVAYDAGRFDERADELLRAFEVVRLPPLAVNAGRAVIQPGAAGLRGSY